MREIGATQPLRKLKLALLLGLSFLPRILSAQSDSIINWGDPPSIGFVIRSQDPPWYSIALDVGLEQWEEGKRVTQRYHLWRLTCDANKRTGPVPDCDLERVVHHDWGDLGGWRAFRANESTTNGKLKIVRADWEEGKLDFDVIHPRPDDTTHVFMDLEYKGSLIYMSSFRATSTFRGRLTGDVFTVDLKIPQYTYTLNLPIEMRGLQGRGAKLWDEMITTLSPEDRAAWERIRREGRKAYDLDFDDLLRRKPELQDLIARTESLPPEGQENVAREIKRRLVGLAVEHFEPRLLESGMSGAGRERVLEFLSEQLPKAITDLPGTN